MAVILGGERRTSFKMWLQGVRRSLAQALSFFGRGAEADECYELAKQVAKEFGTESAQYINACETIDAIKESWQIPI
jgi:hypothetical protein